MTIEQTVQWIAAAFFTGCLLVLIIGVLQFRSARRLPYFLLRKEGMTRGWRLFLLSLALFLSAVITKIFGQEAVYVIIPPTASITPSPTITYTPTITPTPTVTNTPLATHTATVTPTSTETPIPQLPAEIRILIRETQSPRPAAVFSPMLVSRRLNRQNQAVGPEQDFEEPLGRLYGAFTYNNLQDGVRWTAVWRIGDQVVCIETQPWDGGTGGYGYTECEVDTWSAGEYEIQMFYGEEWMVSTRFEVLGDPATGTIQPDA